MPTCSRRPWEDETPTASAAPHSLPQSDGPELSDPALANLAQRKLELRQKALAVRETCDPAVGATLAQHVLTNWPPPTGSTVAGFWPMGLEIDIRPLLRSLHSLGHLIVLPQTPPRGQPLTFRVWQPNMAMVGERFGTSRPTGEERRPDILFVPLLAFDAKGGRLGYGGGFYDRTLAELPDALAIGCAYAAQEVDEVPMGPTDMPLHGVATERGVRRFDPEPRSR